MKPAECEKPPVLQALAPAAGSAWCRGCVRGGPALPACRRRLSQGQCKENADGDEKGGPKTCDRRKSPTPQDGTDQRSGDGTDLAGDAQPGKERSAFGFGGS